MYLTCNPGGIGHSWVKRLFVDRKFRGDERPEDYSFIPALVFDNQVLISCDPDYVKTLETLPEKLRDAWLFGRWDVFEGQFFPEFDSAVHVCKPSSVPNGLKYFASLDYGFDMLAVLLFGVDRDGRVYVIKEHCESGLTLSEGADRVAELCRPYPVEIVFASPDLWNRRQDSGRSGFEIMQNRSGMPPMLPADDRRVSGWRLVREYLCCSECPPKLLISQDCPELIRCMGALLFDKNRSEDASSEPHEVTHAPEALRYGLMGRVPPPSAPKNDDFHFGKKRTSPFFD